MSEFKAPTRTPKHGELLFVLIFVLFAVFLLSQMPEQVKWFKRTKLASQPALWPAIGVIGMVVFGALHAITQFKGKSRQKELREGARWLRAFEFVGWFMVYVWLVPIVGYLPMTLIIAPLLCYRLGYRDRKILWAAAGVGLTIVVVFKAFLDVKIPGALSYEYLPGGIRNFMILNF